MIAAPVQGDVDGISKGSHYVRPVEPGAVAAVLGIFDSFTRPGTDPTSLWQVYALLGFFSLPFTCMGLVGLRRAWRDLSSMRRRVLMGLTGLALMGSLWFGNDAYEFLFGRWE